jgi:hypothetical protein
MSPFDLQNVNTEQNSIEQYKTEQHMTNILGIEQILCYRMFGGLKVILVF